MEILIPRREGLIEVTVVREFIIRVIRIDLLLVIDLSFFITLRYRH